MNEVTEQTEKIPYYTTPYFARVKDAVDDIYKRTSGTMPFSGGLCSVNKNDLYRKAAMALMNEEIVVNLGKSYAPSYIWKTSVKLSESVYHRVYLRIREINKRYTDNLLEKRKATAARINNNITTTKKNTKMENKVNTEEKKTNVVNTVTLDGFTDQQLWDELKARGFGFVDGRLSKTIYLN